jgi:hypothetical protein
MCDMRYKVTFIHLCFCNGSAWWSHVPLPLLRSYQNISPDRRLCLWIFRNKIRFNREELLAPRPTTKLEDHPLSAVRDCLFSIFAATLHIGGRSSIRNRHAVVTGTHLSHGYRNNTVWKLWNFRSGNLLYNAKQEHGRCMQSVFIFLQK